MNREIGKEDLDDSLHVRLGGMNRVIESSNSSKLGVLELVLYPPSRVEEGLGAVGGFDGDPGVMQLDIPAAGDASPLATLFGKHSPLSCSPR